MCTRMGSLVHRYLRTNVDKLIKICILYFINEYENYTMKFMRIKTSVLSSSELYSQKIYQSLYHGSFNRINVRPIVLEFIIRIGYVISG
jgi:hypothetical protein